MAEPVILASDAEAYANDVKKQASLRGELLHCLSGLLGYGDVTTLTDERKAELNEELDDLVDNWDDAEVDDMSIKADTELQKMLARFVDLGNGLGAYHDGGLEEVVERWYEGKLPPRVEN